MRSRLRLLGEAFYSPAGVTRGVIVVELSPARKAHPAFSVTDYDELLARLAEAGIEIREDDSIPGVRRCYVVDPWGNRVELLRG